MLENLNLILYAVFISLLGLGFLFGLIKGFKKSLYNFIVLLLFYCLFFVSINWMAEKIWVLDIPGLGSLLDNFIPELKNASSLQEALPVMLNEYLGDSMNSATSSEEFMEFTTGISLLIVKLIYTILYFTIFYLIYKFIFFIIRISFFRTRDDAPKHRALGGVFGLLKSALFIYFLLIFAGGLIGIATDVNKMMGENEPTIKQVGDAYHNNAIVKAADLIQVEKNNDKSIPATDYLFDRILSFEYNKQQIAIRNEIAVASDAYETLKQHQYNETFDASDITGDDIKDMVDILTQSELFMSAIPVVIEMSANYLDTTISEETLEKLYSDDFDWETEIYQLAEVAAITFDMINSAGVLDEDTNLETVTFNGEDVEALFNSLSDSDIVTLTAYEVLEPLLIEASADLQGVITVPEGLDWEVEIRAIGQIASQVVSTQLTVADLKEGDTGSIISSLSTIDYTDLLDSKIISHALKNIFSGSTNLSGFDQLVVPSPETIKWFDTLDNEGNVTEEGELRKILIAINEFSEVSNDIDFSNIDINIVSKFNDDVIEAFFESQVLTATVSTKIEELNLGQTQILIPDSVYQGEYIDKEELKKLAVSARTMVEKVACDEGETCASGFDFSKAINLSDTDLDTVFQSQILGTSIGHLILDQGGAVLTIPDSTKDYVIVDGTSREIISEQEVRNIFKAVSSLDIKDFNNMNFDASLMQNLATEEDPTDLDETKVNNILTSKIIHATVSTMLFDLAEGTTSVLVVPQNDFNGVPIRDTDQVDQIEYITQQEIEAILQGVLTLELSDFNTINDLDITKLTNNMGTLLDSAIFHATVSKQLTTLSDNYSDIIVPFEDENGLPIRHNEYVIEGEIQALLDVLLVLQPNITDISNFDGNIDVDQVLSQKETLLASATIQATVSKMILDQGQLLVVPTNETIEAQTVTYIKSSELNQILVALDSLNITDFNNIDTSANTILNMEFAPLLDSKIMQATISKNILDNATIVYQQTDLDTLSASAFIIASGELEQLEAYQNPAVDKQIDRYELEYILNGLQDLGSGFTGTVESPTENIELTTLNSKSIHMTISNMLNSNGVLTIPNIPDDVQKTYGNYIETGSITIISKEEIMRFVNSMNQIDVTNIAGASFDFNILFNLTDPATRDAFLASYIVRATLTEQLRVTYPNIVNNLDASYFEVDGTTLTTDGIYLVLGI